MPTTAPFETLTAEYDDWFETNRDAYRAELAALERVLAKGSADTTDYGEADRSATLEIGVGTGRFAGPLEIPVGIDPAMNPLLEARDRGVDPIRGVAERLPVRDDTFECVVVITVWCFLDDIEGALAETRRVLASDGELVVAFLDRSSPMGRVYQENKDESPFYADARFVTGEEVCTHLEDAGFVVRERLQTVFNDSDDAGSEPGGAATSDAGDDTDGDTLDDGNHDLDADDPIHEGHGEGLFGVVRAALE